MFSKTYDKVNITYLYGTMCLASQRHLLVTDSTTSSFSVVQRTRTTSQPRHIGPYIN